MTDNRQGLGSALQAVSDPPLPGKAPTVPHRMTRTPQPQILVRVPPFGIEPVQELVQRLRRPSADVEGFVLQFIDRGMPAEAILLDLFAPAARKLGDLWVKDDCSFVDVTVATGRLQQLVHVVSDRFQTPPTPPSTIGRILLSVVPGDQHSLGLVMVGEFFRREGWDLCLAQMSTDNQVLLALVEHEWFDVAAFSVACEENLPRLRRLIRDLRKRARNREMRVLVGGALFDEEGRRANELGVDGWTADAASAVQLAASLL